MCAKKEKAGCAVIYGLTLDIPKGSVQVFLFSSKKFFLMFLLRGGGARHTLKDEENGGTLRECILGFFCTPC